LFRFLSFRLLGFNWWVKQLNFKLLWNILILLYFILIKDFVSLFRLVSPKKTQTGWRGLDRGWHKDREHRTDRETQVEMDSWASDQINSIRYVKVGCLHTHRISTLRLPKTPRTYPTIRGNLERPSFNSDVQGCLTPSPVIPGTLTQSLFVDQAFSYLV
jgi:hypothetical protein